jgi:L-ascorbate metabolism protein UlaG (beta-lactamase superfamily)
MDLTWLGHACVRLRGKEGVVLMDPCARSTGYTLGKQAADIVTASRRDPEHAFTEIVTSEHRLLDAPGEYEIQGILLTGVQTDHPKKDAARNGAERTIAFVVQIDDLRVCHLGDLSHTPDQALIEELSDIDVLLTPVGGHGALDAAGAAEVISLLQPRIVVPMRYRTDSSSGDLDPLEPFFKQLGRPAPEPVARLSVTRSNLPDETQIAVLDYRK